MTKSQLRREALDLPVEERLELAEALWESVEAAAQQPPLPDWQRQILDERIAADDADLEAGSPWQEVKQRMTIKTLSPTSYTMKFEVSIDGTNWMTFMEGKATKK